jgi:enhancing lycopene biosynthesis protein 2
MARVAVVLSGCGYLDGAEIQEAVFSLYFLDRAGASVQCFAPDKDQMHVVDHLTGQPTNETRNVLRESARIARGEIKALSEARMADFDALVMPGGYGVAKNLSSFATQGANADVDPDLLRLIGEAHAARKPILAICISPAILAAALKKSGAAASLTVGNDAETAQAIEALGSTHENCPVNDYVADEQAKVISTPAYMLGPGPKDVAAGIEGSIQTLMSWLRTPVA